MNRRFPHVVSRRNFLASSAAAAAGTWLLPPSLLAQATSETQAGAPTQTPPPALPLDFIAQARAAAASAKITTQALRGNVSVLMGSGGNIAVLTGPQGKLLVDSGFSTSQPQIAAALTALSADPVKQLINTHWHFDHTDGNEWMHTAGATILAHTNTATRLSAPQYMAAFNAHLPAAPVGARPTETFADTRSLKFNGETLQLAHYNPAHTDTDISVVFTGADVLHTGDTWFNGFYPFIDYSSGGNIDGMIAAAAKNLAMSTSTTMIVPGHGPIGTKAQLADFHDMLAGIREKVAALKKSGNSVDAAIAAKPTAMYDAKYGAGFLPPGVFVRLVYQGV